MWEPVVGKYGRTRAGRKVEPIDHGPQSFTTWKFKAMDGGYYDKNGVAYPYAGGEPKPSDLVSEWVDGPVTAPTPDLVRVVTRHEVVPGQYGPFVISSDTPAGFVWMSLSPNRASMTAEALRSAASVFTRIADALDANRNEEAV